MCSKSPSNNSSELSFSVCFIAAQRQNELKSGDYKQNALKSSDNKQNVLKSGINKQNEHKCGDYKQNELKCGDYKQALTGTRGYSTTRFLSSLPYPTRKILLLDRVVE